MKYFFSPCQFCARSLTSGRRSKSKFPPDVTQTTVWPWISSRISSSHVDRKGAGGLQHDALDVQHLLDRDADAILGCDLHIHGCNTGRSTSKVRSPIRATAAPSTNVSVIGMVLRCAGAQRGRQAGAPRRLDQREPGFGADRIEKRDPCPPTGRHRPPAGSADRAHGPSPRSSRPRPRPAPRSRPHRRRATGNARRAPRNRPWPRPASSSKKSPVSTISTAPPPKVRVLRIFCSGVVTGM